jgi:glutamate-1-semialdehyde 2,1-aminomutase
MIPTFALVAGAAVTALGADKAAAASSCRKAKHPSLAGHVRWGKRIASQIPATRYDEAEAFRVDGAPADILAARQAGFDRLAALFAERFAKSRALTAETKPGLSDLQFTGVYRVPVPVRTDGFDSAVGRHFLRASDGPITHRSRRQSPVGSHRFLWRQSARQRSLQGLMPRRSRRPSRSAPCWAGSTRSWPTMSRG